MKKQNLYAVLTGDIVKSSNLESNQLKELRQRISESLEEFNRSFKKQIIIGNIDFFRGDGWQILLSEPHYSLRIALLIRAALRSGNYNDTRISVGIGTIESINEQNISMSTGEAFEFSGTGLDRLKSRNFMAISGKLSAQKLEISIFELCDAIVQSWTVTQSQAIYNVIQGLEFKDINISTSKQAFYALLAAANWQAIEGTLLRLEKLR